MTPSRQLVSLGYQVDLLPYIPQLEFFPLPVKAAKLWLKREMDFICALLFLVTFSPLFLLIAALIKLTSPGGAVFFRQERVGLNRRPFLMWKFRTMVPDAEKQDGALCADGRAIFFKPKMDPRVTRVGRVLRKYSLDELPQFINVLKGEMSLVGPRPLREFEVVRFDSSEQYRRFDMKPGLTCIWQVSGRSKTTDEARMAYDLEYVDKWSLALDFKLLLKTVPVVVKAEGAV